MQFRLAIVFICAKMANNWTNFPNAVGWNGMLVPLTNLPHAYMFLHVFLYILLHRLSMGCHTVSPAQIWVRIPGPTTRVRGEAEGSRDPYEYWGRWHNFGKTYLNCIIVQVLEIYFDIPCWHSVSERDSVNNSCKWGPVIRSPAHYPLLLQLPIVLHSMTLVDI